MDVLRLRQMVEQIARNLAARGEDAAVAALAEHIVQFWDPRMRAALLADDRENLSPVARRAIELLAAQTATASLCREVDTPLP
jgi:formate dehydrogenase subunit delta